MKTSFCLSLIFFFITSIQAQVIVEGVNINELDDVTIIRMASAGQAFSKKRIIIIDYGQELKWGDRQGSMIKDRRGDIQKFNSEIAAVNWLENNGWEFMETSTLISGSTASTSSFNYYYFRKKNE